MFHEFELMLSSTVITSGLLRSKINSGNFSLAELIKRWQAHLKACAYKALRDTERPQSTSMS
jgi:hypothetical protein